MFRALCVFTTGLLLSHSQNVLAVSVFNPGGFDINAVACPAIDRVLNQTVNITIGEYNVAYMRFKFAMILISRGVEYVDINPSAKTAILMVHGWPSLWSSWARQIEHFKAFRMTLQMNGRPSCVCFRTIIAWWPSTSADLEGPRIPPTSNRRVPWRTSPEI